VTCALTTDGAPDRLAHGSVRWGRFNVYQWDTATTLTAKLKGCYGWPLNSRAVVSLPFQAKNVRQRKWAGFLRRYGLR